MFDREDLPFPRSLPEFQKLFPDDAACALLQGDPLALEHQLGRLETQRCGVAAARGTATCCDAGGRQKRIEAGMRAIADSNPAKKALFARLTSLKEVGLVLARTSLAEPTW